jgi:3'-phosphoadenosine 5'-phosphosulfate sulfotransferase (PAPS reductase)/FAD synthetase
MNDPFLITSPTCISFSGGRTSAYMLWRVIQSGGGQLPCQTIVCFANTGKEDEATLRFVRDCSINWAVPITWLEYQPDAPGFKVVSFETASREGQPFEAIISKRNYLPNPVARFCTVELKIQPEHKYLKSLGWSEWDNMIGIRADEPRRVAKIKANPSGGKSGPERIMPLAQANITKEDVGRFWRAQAFDLELPNHNGVTYHGNCDLCFLKGASQILSLIAEKPARAAWWARMETSITNAKIQNGGRFRSDRPSYASMAKFTEQQRDMFDADEEGIACFCGD